MRAFSLAISFTAIAIASGIATAQNPKSADRGQVFDMGTGRPIPFAIVAGKYMGGVAYRGGGCNRIESVVADADGWFTLPPDPQSGPIVMQAYSHGYGQGQSPRVATNLREGDPNKWVVVVVEWDLVAMRSKIVRREPTIYPTYDAAAAASRQFKDLYLARFVGTPAERLMDLQSLTGAAICGGGPKTTKGPIEFLDAIYREQVEMGASAEMLTRTTRIKGYFAK